MKMVPTNVYLIDIVRGVIQVCSITDRSIPSVTWHFFIVFYSSFLFRKILSPFAHEYLMNTSSNLKADVRNEFLDLKNIHTAHITDI